MNDNDAPPLRFRVSAPIAQVYARPNVSAVVMRKEQRGVEVVGVLVSGALYRGVSHWLELDDGTGYMWRGSLQEVAA